MASKERTLQKISQSTMIYDPPPDTTPATADAPTTILICGFMNATPRNMSRYSDRYKALYPAARIILITSTLTDIPGFTVFRSAKALKQRVDVPAKALIARTQAEGDKLLIHAFSNGGAITVSEVGKAYQRLTGQPLPARTIVLDSLPGGDSISTELGRWINALSVGLPSNPLVQWPARVLIALVVLVLLGLPSVLGGENAITRAKHELNDESLISIEAKRLYVYSDADALVGAKDVKQHAAEAEAKGWAVETLNFGDSGHVRHAIVDKERYWDAVLTTWNSSV